MCIHIIYIYIYIYAQIMYTHGFNRFCVIGGEPSISAQLLSMKNQVLPQMWQAQVRGVCVVSKFRTSVCLNMGDINMI